MSPLEDLGLLPAQGTVDPVARDLGVAGRPPLGGHSAVVAGEDDQRVGGHLEPIERVEHFAHRPVEFVDEVAIDAIVLVPAKRAFGFRGEWMLAVRGRGRRARG